MFGATALRQKRERERRARAARLGDSQVFPYIKPFGPRFDKMELPYFKYRETLKLLNENSAEAANNEQHQVDVNIRSQT